MAVRYDLLHPKALRAALIEAGVEGVPTERQVRRWITGVTPIPGWARRTIDELVGTTKEAAEPPWVQRLEDRLYAIEAAQSAIADSAVEKAITALAPADQLRQAEMLNQRLEELLRLRAEASPERSSVEGLDEEVLPGQ